MAVNTPPTFSAFTSVITSGNENTTIQVGLNDLLLHSNATDSNGTVTAFVISAITTGTLKIGTTATTATNFDATTNNTIDANLFAFWTPPANSNGALSAFTAVAIDNGGAVSTTPVQATVTVIPDSPTVINDSFIISNGSNLTTVAQNYLLSNSNFLVNNLGTAATITDPTNPLYQVPLGSFGENVLAPSDDGSSPAVDISSVFANGINFFGTTYTSLYVNTNGSISFGQAASTYLPDQFHTGTTAIIAPFMADVDTRGGAIAVPTLGGNSTGSNLVYYDIDPTNGVITITWDDVSYNSYGYDKGNAFQLQLINSGNGDYNIVMRYEGVQWTSGDYNGGTLGLGGTPASAGLSAGDGNSMHHYELPSSGNEAALLNLSNTAGNTGINGVDIFSVHNGLTNNVLTNDSDPDGDILTVSAVNGIAANVGQAILLNYGTLTLAADGSYTYAINPSNLIYKALTASQSVIETATYTASDGHGGTSNASLSLTLQGVNDPPTGAVIITGNTLQNQTLTADTSTIADAEGLGTFNYQWFANNVAITGATSSTLALTKAEVNQTITAQVNYVDGGGTAESLTSAATAPIGGPLDTVALSLPTDIIYTDTPFIDNFSTNNGTFTATDLLLNPITYNIQNGTDNGDGTTSLTTSYGVLTITQATGAYNFVPNQTTIEPLAANTSISANITATVGSLTDTKAINIVINQLGITESDGNDLLTGTAGNDVFNGLAGNDTIYGGAGNDYLDGDIGADSLIGGTGNDTYIVDNTGDIVVETSTIATEIDTVNSSVTYTLSANVENLTLTDTIAINGTGNSLANYITGNSGNNLLTGAAGFDTLDGGAGNDTLVGGAGNDVMIGGTGNDTYNVDSAGDVVTETSTIPTEIDTVNSSIDYTLGANLENLGLMGTAINGTGNSLNNLIIGNASNNYIFGDIGNDTLNGGAGDDTLDGGTGNDKLNGGIGNDTYIIDSTGDVATETSTLATEIDTIISSITYTLLTNFENLTLTGTTALNGTGNVIANVITGNSAANNLLGAAGNDTIYGGDGNDTLNGGIGDDSMIGGTGNDTYIVDSTADVVVETSTLSTEIDTVNTTITYTLGANIETLNLVGANIINGTGNNLNNTLNGNASANTLSGGDGNDSINGGAGDDSMDGGNGNDILLGGIGNDILNGGNGNDILSGGDGNDTLTGGAGVDSFLYNIAANASTNFDTITDFTSGSDQLKFTVAVLTTLGAIGQFAAGDQRFWSSNTGLAHNATDRLIYNTSTGVVSYDSDGNGVGTAIQIEVLGTTTHPALVATDIFVV